MPGSEPLRGDEDAKKAEISQWLSTYQRSCMSLERADNNSKFVGLVVNACHSLRGKNVKKFRLKGITIDASIVAKQHAFSCRVGLYKLHEKFKDNFPQISGYGFGCEDHSVFMKEFSRETKMAVMDYTKIEIVKEEILDLQIGGRSGSDSRRIKWDIIINDRQGESVHLGEDGLPCDNLYMFCYHLNRQTASEIYYASMMYYCDVIKENSATSSRSSALTSKRP